MSVFSLAPDVGAAFQLVPASRYTLVQLAAAYNRTRQDYLVPMPLDASRLAEYIRLYDIDLDRSVIAAAGEQILGLGMLGVRPGRAWITRLGVVPSCRQHGLGRALVEALLAAARQLRVEVILLEVIKHNHPAHHLFARCGFADTRELLVLHRPAGPPAQSPASRARWLGQDEALALLDTRPKPQSWLTETESLRHAAEVSGLWLTLPDGSQGWLVFQAHRGQNSRASLSRLSPHTLQGDARLVGRALLAHLYHRYPDRETYTENIPAGDVHVPAFQELGHVESFRRIEMRRVHVPRRKPR